MTNTEEQEDQIYIKCNPTAANGEDISDEEDNVVNSGVSPAMLNELTKLTVSGDMFNNTVFQSIIGVTAIALLYGLGNYVFKEFPTNSIANKVSRTTIQ